MEGFTVLSDALDEIRGYTAVLKAILCDLFTRHSMQEDLLVGATRVCDSINASTKQIERLINKRIV